MHSTGEPVFENGEVTRLIGNTLDITEQENNERNGVKFERTRTGMSRTRSASGGTRKVGRKFPSAPPPSSPPLLNAVDI